MGPAPSVNPKDLHLLLWTRSDRLHRLRVIQRELATELGVSKFIMSRAMTKLVDQGRIRQLSNQHQLSGVFLVVDPTEWQPIRT